MQESAGILKVENLKKHFVIDSGRGNKKVLKKQWIAKPITRTSPDDVYLSSDYNKTHIFRKGASLNRNTSALSKIITAVLSEPEKFKEIYLTYYCIFEQNSSFGRCQLFFIIFAAKSLSLFSNALII